jgi:hypothetical protein
MPNKQILSIPPSNWILSQVIVLDWYDGPKSGFYNVENSDILFFFELFASYRSHDTDDFLFRLYILPYTSMAKVIHIISPLGLPNRKIWVPIWKFKSSDEQRDIEKQLDTLILNKQPTSLIIRTLDFKKILGVWELESV